MRAAATEAAVQIRATRRISIAMASVEEQID
jgi:hypothetical protein